ncbi:hypothetical protein OHB26_13430 [Nocardia sp. NBC_01503]|uniref:hypothetical protein n=1 Tax=Nocardia sp. NBC_01503 TaxID=2975997 RepID=UPI002E7B34CB|nr:hypothetical protein [Nocardia sp. NBC_01503]WTL35103.1 hypothetical protein OHB26_13430 [Nocardia sp. NBC_01503]
MPIDFGWTSNTSALQLDLLAYSLPRAIAAGVLVAMISAVLITTLGSIVIAWSTALGGLMALTVNHIFGHQTEPSSALSTLNFIDSLAGGLVLGALGAAVLHHRLPAYGWTLGIITSVLLGSVSPMPHLGGVLKDGSGTSAWESMEMPPLWMLELALVLVAIGTLSNRNRTPAERPSIELPLAPILAGVVLVLVTVASAEWLARHGDTFAGIGVAVVTTVATALIAAMLLPGRDGELVLVTVGLSAVGSAALAAELPAWTIPLAVAITVFGMWYGTRRGAPMTCLVLILLLGLFTAITANSDRAILTVGGTAALAWLVGYGLTSANPRFVPNRVLATMVIFIPSAVLGLRDYVARGHYAMQDSSKAVVCTVVSEDTSAPGWTASLIVIGCIGGLYALRRNRSAATAPGGDTGEAAAQA